MLASGINAKGFSGSGMMSSSFSGADREAAQPRLRQAVHSRYLRRRSVGAPSIVFRGGLSVSLRYKAFVDGLCIELGLVQP
jgi:hypothetical protein